MISESIQTVHDCNILHCDIRPPNILKFSDTEYQLIDFGLSRTISSDACTSIVSLKPGDGQREATGFRIKKKANEYPDSEINVHWTTLDDWQMLIQLLSVALNQKDHQQELHQRKKRKTHS